MKLINRKTNEMAYFGDGIIDLRKLGCENVAEMIEAGWEDYREEPCFISEFGKVHPISCMGGDRQRIKWLKEIGNYFETEEEAEKAVEKLKAWKRLKDNKFRFETFGYDRETVKNGRVNIMVRATFDEKYGDGSIKLSDLDLLFGGGE